MGNVYQKTIRNIIWLGQSEPYTAKAMQLIETMCCDFLQANDSYDKLLETMDHTSHRNWYSECPPAIDPLVSFFSNPWFERI